MIIKDKYVYNVDENNIVTIWEKDKYDVNEAPFIYQMFNPDNFNLPFNSSEEATNWVESYLNAIINPVIIEPATEE